MDEMISPKGRVFESGDYPFGGRQFRVGTVHGLYHVDPGEEALILIAIMNDQPGNGDVDDALWFFEESVRRGICKRFLVVEIWNERFRAKLERRRYARLEEFITQDGEECRNVLEFIDAQANTS